MRSGKPLSLSAMQQTKIISLRAAYHILGQKIILQKSNSSVKKARKKLIVKRKRQDDKEFLITGGQCSHTVVFTGMVMAGASPVLVCIDHSPAHKPTKPGNACSHISAVQLMLAKEIMMKGGNGNDPSSTNGKK